MSIFTGYSGRVWSAVYAALAYYTSALDAAPSTLNVTTLSQAMYQSLRNGAEAINMNNAVVAWSAEYTQFVTILNLPLVLDPTSQAYVAARVTAYQGAYLALTPLVPQPPYGAPGSIADGIPTIPYPGLLEFYSTFNYETAPSGLTATNLVADATTMSTSFVNLAQALNIYQGAQLTSLYDVATREAQITADVALQLGSLTSGPFASDVSGTNAWNQIVALPAIFTCANLLSSAPFTAQAQQQAVIRYTMLAIAQQIAQFILVLSQPQTSEISLTVLRNGETLMDVAARTLGDFEQWTAIATLNGLMPPYTGPQTAPGIAGWGSQLILPTPGTQLSAGGAVPSYGADFLGTDLYIGPINGSMPAWTGDYQTITSYANLAWALGRRLQTTLGSLIYHESYGSRIPPEVGAIQSSATIGNIVAYGTSALLSDPRVRTVLKASANGSQGQLVAFNATVQPGGFGTTPIVVNQVITSAARG